MSTTPGTPVLAPEVQTCPLLKKCFLATGKRALPTCDDVADLVSAAASVAFVTIRVDRALPRRASRLGFNSATRALDAALGKVRARVYTPSRGQATASRAGCAAPTSSFRP